MMAAVRGVTAAATASGSSSPSGRTSANTGIAPALTIAAVEATKEFGGVMISSPAPRPAAIMPKVSASVPELSVTAWLAPRQTAPRGSRRECARGGLGSLCVELRDRVDDVLELLPAKMLVHRQREGASRVAVGDREVSGPITEMAQSLLAIQGDGVVDLAFDAAFLAELQQGIAPFRENLIGHLAVPPTPVPRPYLTLHPRPH